MPKQVHMVRSIPGLLPEATSGHRHASPSSRLSHLFPLPCCKQMFQVSKACPATNRPASMLLLSETHAGAAAVHGGASAAPPKSGDVYTEADWNETSTLENKEGYWVSKASGGQLAHGDVRPADCGGCCVSGANKLQPTMGSHEAGISSCGCMF